MFAARRRSLTLVAAAAFLVGPAACSDSTAPNGTMTPEEARELALQMGLHLSGGASASAASASAASASAASASAASAAAASAAAGDAQLNAVPAPFEYSVTDVEVPCPRGGNTLVSATIEGTYDDKGTFDEVDDAVVADVNGTQRLNNCGYEVHGKTFRLTGSLTMTAHVEIDHGLPVGTHTASVTGEFTWRASDGRRGTCAVSYNATANYTTDRAVVNGNFCGSTVQFDGPLTD
jgi:hypothetical protein